LAPCELFARADHHAAAFWLDPHDKSSVAQGDAQPLPLADGEPFDSGVPPDHRAVGRDDFAGRILCSAVATNELVVLAGGDEADFLAVRLGSHPQVKLCGL